MLQGQSAFLFNWQDPKWAGRTSMHLHSNQPSRAMSSLHCVSQQTPASFYLQHQSTNLIQSRSSFSKSFDLQQKKKRLWAPKTQQKSCQETFCLQVHDEKVSFSLARQRKSYSVMMMFKYHWFRAFVKKKKNSWIKRIFYGLINKKNFLLVNLQKINVSDWKLYMTLSFIISLDQVTFHETG